MPKQNNKKNKRNLNKKKSFMHSHRFLFIHEKKMKFFKHSSMQSHLKNKKIWFWCIHLCFLILKKIKK